MINALHLLWIVPLSAVAGVVLTVGIVIFDDCLWWASDKCEEKNNGITHENEPPILPPEDWPEEYVREVEEELRRDSKARRKKRKRRRKP